jgi:hypothetical protein
MPSNGEIHVPPPPPSNPETLDHMRALIAEARQQGYAEGVKAERTRVMRARNEVFAGVRVDDDMRTLIVKFDGLLLRGEEPRA